MLLSTVTINYQLVRGLFPLKQLRVKSLAQMSYAKVIWMISIYPPGPRRETTNDRETSICGGMLAIFGIFVGIGLLSFCYLFLILSYFYLLQRFFDFVSFLSQCLLTKRMLAISAGSMVCLWAFSTLVKRK